MLHRGRLSRIKEKQRGASAVEFGIIAVLFFTIFFGVIEFGRFFYLYNTVQEVTRCAARQAVVSWKGNWGSSGIPQQCLFGQNELVAGWEIRDSNIQLRALNLATSPNGPYGDANPDDISTNIANCTSDPENQDCIRIVEARLCSGSACGLDPTGTNASSSGILYQPMFGLIPLRIAIPSSIVLMPAESLGYSP